MQQKYRRVSYEYRCQISALLEIKISIGEISKRLKVHRSTVYRELGRNRSSYDSKEAQKRYLAMRIRCRRLRVVEKNPGLLKRIKSGLKFDVSPEQIAARVGGISHQTIYNELRNHRNELLCYLRRYGRRRGRPRANRRSNIEKPAWFQSISDRPPEVEAREEAGHWERDTMYVKDRKMLLVCVERKSRFVRIEKVKKCQVEKIGKQTLRMTTIKNMPPKTITNDNGHEFYSKTSIEVPVFFCDPYAPQQRGSVENMIGLIRQFVGKHADFERITSKLLRKIEHRLNHRPKKCLKYRTPYEVLFGETVALAF